MYINNILSIYKFRGVVVFDCFGIIISFKNWIGFNNLVFKSIFLKLEIKSMFCYF